MVKIISMYLPQFHRVKENDEWWGVGFTEWVAVKNARKYFEGQYQPRVPLNKNYYNLLDKDTMIWQAELMERYGVDGQCIYHYWFKDGRQILEKPAENLLRWKDIQMPFCFCWANESWARTWSNIGEKNTWASNYEQKEESSHSGILLEQKYGNESDWREHFEYLVRFFQDERYIKIDDKPVFVIYKTQSIACLDDMIVWWDKWAREFGFKGIYIIGANAGEKVSSKVDSILYLEPDETVKSVKNRYENGLKRYDYRELWEGILSAHNDKKNIIFGGVVDFDTTPRHGKGGVVFDNVSPALFQEYLSRLIAKNEANNQPFVFIDAWNEWGEGMYLEPDEKNGYAYLEAVRNARRQYEEYLALYKEKDCADKVSDQNNANIIAIAALKERVNRYEDYWKILNDWLIIKEEGKRLEAYFEKSGISDIAIYGMGMLGRHLYTELTGSKVKVQYAIDRQAESIVLDVPVHTPDEDLPETQAIIVTATYDFLKIKKGLEEKGYKKVISLKDVILETV